MEFRFVHVNISLSSDFNVTVGGFAGIAAIKRLIFCCFSLPFSHQKKAYGTMLSNGSERSIRALFQGTLVLVL